MDVEVLMKKKKNVAAAYVQSECARTNIPETLKVVLDTLLDPLKGIDDWEAIDWCKWLMAGGCSPDEFTENVRKYDNATTCGLVWTANFVAYRCRTCGISPCMSLCAECFQRGNHKGHDFNMFRSQAGGACDCGDMNVMKEGGFCYLHGPHSQNPANDGPNGAPPDLLCVAIAMMPRLVLRLIQHMRANSNSLSGFLGAVQEADKFITMLHDMSSMGAAMRQVMTHALTNPQIYKSLTDLEEIDCSAVSPGYYDFMSRSKQAYEEALTSLPNPEPPEEYKDIPSLQKDLVHRTFLEEFVFWTAKFEFPQKVVCLLLNLLPDEDYKEAFTRAFVLHYSRISQLLVQSTDPDMLSNRVVHVSVQLFSNEKLALRMTEQMGLLHVMVISLRYMMDKITIANKLHNKDTNSHRVVDCGHVVMKDHCYWPLVSDLNNILSHRPVALRFLEDDGLLKMWFNFQSLFQGMNVNHREMEQHIEFEPTTYYAAFSAELEASASPMWALVSHLRDASTAHLTKNLLRHCRSELQDWLKAINYEDGHDFQLHPHNDEMQVSFHLPLHRYFAVFLYQAVRNQGLTLAELLPPPSELRAMVHHPLRVQTAFYEIITGLWVRNGLQIKGQAMTYVQCHFCNSMVDADLFLLQVAMTNLPYGDFISTVLEKFHIMESLSISSSGQANSYLEPDQEMLMMENCLILLATLGSIRTAIGVSDADLVTLEMTTLLCMADKTHSQLMELMPERCGNSSQSRDFEAVLSKVADYRAPNFESSGNMLQGMYVPKSFVWETIYDPIYILLRAVHRREFQTSLDRFAEYAKHSGQFKGSGTPWPPYRVPAKAAEQYTDPRYILHSRVLEGLLFVIFYKAIHTSHISDQLVALSVFLLEMALSVTDMIGPNEMITQPDLNFGRYDMNFASWYNTDCLFTNLRSEVDSVLVKPTPNDSDSSDENSNDDVMEVESYDGEVEMYEDAYSAESLYGMPDSPSASLAIMPPGPAANQENEGSVSLLSRPSASRTEVSVIPLAPTPAFAILASRPHLALDNASSAGMRPSLLNRSASGSVVRGGEGLRPRNMQVVLTPLKPVVSMHKKELERSSSSSVGNTPSVAIVINESIISLLLSLHSKMSSSPDSYIPFWERPEGQKIVTDALAGVQNGLEIVYIDDCQSTSSADRPNYTFSHAKLNEILNPKTEPQSRIGDGAFFIGKVLDEIVAKDQLCREHLAQMRLKLWPKEAEDEEERIRREASEREEKKQRAVDRRRKLMAEMAKQQQDFKKRASEDPSSSAFLDSNDESNSVDSDDVQIKALEYDCVICNQTGPSTPTNPIGLVILLQASSLLGHRRAKDSRSHVLPTNEEERMFLKTDETMTSHNEKRLEELKRQFDDDSWLMAISAGWEGGVHVQTCGHHIHHECLRDYTASLKSQQRQHNISVERGEYFCPLCRQLANSFLPLSSEFGIRKSALVKDRKNGGEPMTPETTVPEIPPSPEANVALEVLKLLKEYPFPVVNCKMVDAMAKTMEEMTNATSLKHRKVGSSKNTKSILLFVNSIARTNLELEVVLRGGSLVSVPSEPQPSTSMASPVSSTSVSKRSCIVPLLHVLGVHYKILSTDPCLPKTWERILGIRLLPDNAVMTPDREVPMLLRDPCSTLLHLLMNLPMHVDSAYFTSIVQAIYNHVYIHSLCVITCRMQERQREEWKAKKSLYAAGSPLRQTDINQLYYLLGAVIGCLEKSPLYLPDSDYGDMDFSSSATSPTRSTSQTQIGSDTTSASSEDQLEIEVQRLLLPFLRISALLRHHLYDQELPFIKCADDEFSQLGQFLSLGLTEAARDQQTHLHDGIKAHHLLHWISPAPLTAIWTWCEDLSSFIGRSQISARFLIESQQVSWGQPKLLLLPHAYDVIFQFYHRKQCPSCNLVPKDPSVCLVCGTMVCMRDPCCKQQSTNVYEATQHALDCGAGTGMFLSVNSSTIVVVRGKRACLWGSVYLDSFGEEDRELKRGKPLFLCQERYRLLQQQWLSHRFDHSPRKWIFHRDAL